MENSVQTFLESYIHIGMITSYLFFAAAAVLFFGYLIKMSFTRDKKNRYDFISKYEVKTLWYTTVLLILGTGLFVNSMRVEEEFVAIFIKLLSTILFSVLIGVVVSVVLRFYYPSFLEARLKKLRYAPRVSPHTGKEMKLLSEAEEDVYLDEGMQAEENIFSIDYDVWVDEVSGYTKIEKYAGHLHANKCPECNYQTLKVTREEMHSSQNNTKEGQLTKFYRCGYCGHKERKSFNIAKLREIKEVAKPAVEAKKATV